MYHNSLGTTFCENPDYCGEDVSYLPITNVEGIKQETPELEEATNSCEMPRTMRMAALQLVNTNTASGFDLIIPITGGVIGRSGTIHPDHFQSNYYISNQHARISFNWTGDTVMDLNSINGTKLNGEPLPSGQEVRIRNEDLIVFANLEYVVRLV